jgi:hypothetical protein
MLRCSVRFLEKLSSINHLGSGARSPKCALSVILPTAVRAVAAGWSGRIKLRAALS